MEQPFDVVALVGSLRRDSYTRRLTQALAQLGAPALRLEIVGIGDLPLYNQDDEATPPATWVGFRARVKRADAILFATPEYNRSVPACLKNAVDVGSRPRGQSVWKGKPGAVVSASPGMLGGFGANTQLRQSLTAVDVPTMPHPEAYIAHVDQVLDSSGQFTNPATRDHCAAFMQAFESWIRRFKAA